MNPLQPTLVRLVKINIHPFTQPQIFFSPLISPFSKPQSSPPISHTVPSPSCPALSDSPCSTPLYPLQYYSQPYSFLMSPFAVAVAKSLPPSLNTPSPHNQAFSLCNQPIHISSKRCKFLHCGLPTQPHTTSPLPFPLTFLLLLKHLL